MSFEDWIFALHVLGAATLVGGLVMSWIVVFAFRSVGDAQATLSLNRVAMVGTAAVIAGLVRRWVLASGSRSCAQRLRRGMAG